MKNKDFYEILGITPEEKNLQGDAFSKIVKDKYKKLAVQYHPDKHANKPDAEKQAMEEKFKEVSEAYDTLSNPQKRQQYDFTGTSGGYGNMNDIFDSVFGFNMRQEPRYRGEDVTLKITLTVDEVYNGVPKKYKYKRRIVCPECKGGVKKPCFNCGGSGFISTTQRMGFATVQTHNTCPSCMGQGYTIESSCNRCGGGGTVDEETTVDINIPKGMMINDYLSMPGKGHEIPAHLKGVPGNLNIVLNNVEGLGQFQLERGHLILKKEIPILDIITGTDIEITTPINEKITVHVPQGIKENSQVAVRGKGAPLKNGGKGDFILIIQYRFLEKLSKEQKELIEKLKKSINK
jgi:molecular chaperone DnaJ